MNKYLKYNDYRLLYLIDEGVERALEILFLKYDMLISKVISKYYHYGDKRNDMLQEGRMILFNCIKKYRSDGGASFYSYFYIALHRRYMRIANDEYYKLPIVRDYNNIFEPVNLPGYKISGSNFFDDELLAEIFDECVIGSLSLRKFSIQKGLSYSYIYNKYKLIIYRLKTILSID